MYLEGAQDRSSAENLAQCEAEAAVLEEYKPLSKLGAFCISNPVRASLQSAAAARRSQTSTQVPASSVPAFRPIGLAASRSSATARPCR